VRADLNNALAAIATNNSSATEPTTTYAYQWWADTGSSPTVMKLRNAANSAWITLFQLDGEWTNIAFENGTAAAPSIYFKDSGTDTGFYSPGANQVGISAGGTSALVVDSSQRVGIGTTSPARQLSLFASTAPVIQFINSTTGSTANDGALLYQSGLGFVIENQESSEIKVLIGGSECIRISSTGSLCVGNASPNGNTPGFRADANGRTDIIVGSATVAAFNRVTNDGTIISLRQNDTEEGTISVSGTTVSYNGAHLSRWSQLPGGAERMEILRGTVLSNIDEMCGWDEEENEQLNRMKVSDVEGDPNVSGVFQAWDDDDDIYTDDFYCAMTGDFIIRIAEGVTVQRGDLLMSAGDGTAKPQDDDIIRSKTIAKVTSTHVTCTYDDGSYSVPCVLMAC
jgi:hypothetical protein